MTLVPPSGEPRKRALVVAGVSAVTLVGTGVLASTYAVGWHATYALLGATLLSAPFLAALLILVGVVVTARTTLHIANRSRATTEDQAIKRLTFEREAAEAQRRAEAAEAARGRLYGRRVDVFTEAADLLARMISVTEANLNGQEPEEGTLTKDDLIAPRRILSELLIFGTREMHEEWRSGVQLATQADRALLHLLKGYEDRPKDETFLSAKRVSTQYGLEALTRARRHYEAFLADAQRRLGLDDT